MRRCNCQGNPLSAPSRREFPDRRGAGGMGFVLGDLLHWEKAQAAQNPSAAAAGAAKAPRAKSIIHIFLPGGIAHQETFDPKPYAPIEYRGRVGVVTTKIPGEVFQRELPQTAEIADKLTVIRSMTHGEAAHERGTHNMFTGYRPSPALAVSQHGQRGQPRVRPGNNLPPYVCIPNRRNPYAGTGYLSSSFAPFSLGADPAQRRLHGPRPEPAGRRRRRAFHAPPHGAGRGERPLRQARKSPTPSARWTRSISGPTA